MKLSKKNHGDKVAARIAAGVAGYYPHSRCDGLEVWGNGKQEIVLTSERRARSVLYHWSTAVPADIDWRSKLAGGATVEEMREAGQRELFSEATA